LIPKNYWSWFIGYGEDSVNWRGVWNIVFSLYRSYASSWNEPAA